MAIGNILIELGSLAKWLQALGLILVIWMTFNVISIFVNIRRKKLLIKITHDLSRIEHKLDKVLNRKKR